MNVKLLYDDDRITQSANPDRIVITIEDDDFEIIPNERGGITVNSRDGKRDIPGMGWF